MSTSLCRIIVVLCFMAFSFAIQGQNQEYSLAISRTNTPIQLDGVLDEEIWKNAASAGNFRNSFPVDTGFATAKTEVRMAFDDRNLYISVIAWQKREDYTIPTLRRDFSNGISDIFNVVIDPFRDGLNGFLFSLNPLNVQREATIDNGTVLAYEWDNRWYSAITNHDDRWIVEIAIPFKSIRYTVGEGQNIWHINFLRMRIKNTELSAWSPIPQQYAANNLAFVGKLIWQDPPPRPGYNVAIIPYAIGRYNTEYLRDEQSGEVTSQPDLTEVEAGFDAKVGITPSLNLDLTVNPDFSQVEVDQQVANLSRFELFFPERRQFFLENRDLFATFGFPSTRPFFSRRIGLALNPVKKQNEAVPILAGARLSGKLTNKLRIGALNMLTRRIDWDSTRTLPATNFSVLTAQQKIFARSTMSAIFVNVSRDLNALSEIRREGVNAYNRVAGLEYNLYSQDNRWEGEWYYHRSFSPDKKQEGQTFASFLAFTERKFFVRFGHMYVDSFYTAPAGFVPRNGVQFFFPGAGYVWYFPKHPWLNTATISTGGELGYSLQGTPTDRSLNAEIEVNMKNQGAFGGGFFNNYTYLFEPFDPSNQNDPTLAEKLPIGGYDYSGAFLYFFSSPVTNLQGSIDVSAGNFFNGTLVNFNGNLSYRFQPYGSLGLAYSFNRIRLPRPYAAVNFWLIGPRAELAFTRQVFLSAFFQYNTQTNNLNINTRFQWRFAPVSDIFLVYTDNSYAERIENTPIRVFTPKNKSIVLKVVYWLNV